MKHSWLLLAGLVMFLGSSIEGYAEPLLEEDLETITLSTTLHFLSPAGEDVTVPPGTYAITIGEDGMQYAEPGRGAHVHTDGLFTDLAELPHLRANFIERLRPVDPHEFCAHPLEGILQSVRGVIHAVLVQTLHTGKAQCAVMIAIGGEPCYPVVLDFHLQATTGLTYPAEGVGGSLAWHGLDPSSFIRPCCN